MTKYIDAEKLRAEIDRRIVVFSSLSSDTVNPIRIDEDRQLLSFINSLQQEQPKEICHKCIHHGKDDDYCYNPHGGIQRLINENGVYECTGFYEKEEQPEMDLVAEYDEQFYSDPVYGKLVNRNAGIAVARHFYELGLKAKEENK